MLLLPLPSPAPRFFSSSLFLVPSRLISYLRGRCFHLVLGLKQEDRHLLSSPPGSFLPSYHSSATTLPFSRKEEKDPIAKIAPFFPPPCPHTLLSTPPEGIFFSPSSLLSGPVYAREAPVRVRVSPIPSFPLFTSVFFVFFSRIDRFSQPPPTEALLLLPHGGRGGIGFSEHVFALIYLSTPLGNI